MWLPAVGLSILFGIAIVVIALPARPSTQGSSTPVAATGNEAPSDGAGSEGADTTTVGRVKPPETHPSGAAQPAGANAPAGQAPQPTPSPPPAAAQAAGG